jgi:hypothetical protein
MIICALNQNMLALHFSKILATDDDNKGLNCFHPAFHGKHALEDNFRTFLSHPGAFEALEVS